jgi:hypothetical protein
VTSPLSSKIAVQEFRSDAPGLYGGTLNNASCDRNQMIAFLRQNPAKAAAWWEHSTLTPRFAGARRRRSACSRLASA